MGFSSAEFYNYLEGKKFMGTRCKACWKVYLPPRPICIECFSEGMEWVELSGKGRLLTFTCISVGPSFMVELGHDRKNPYCCGIVKLAEGPQVSGQILGVNPKEPEKIKVGSLVKVEFLKKDEGEKKRYWLGFKVEG